MCAGRVPEPLVATPALAVDSGLRRISGVLASIGGASNLSARDKLSALAAHLRQLAQALR